MAYEGYFEYDGVEIINNSRMSEYAKRMNLSWFNCTNTCPSLPDALVALNDHRVKQIPEPLYYSTPKADNPPWYDFKVPASADFAGVHLLGVSNLDSSTWVASGVESSSDGGSIQGGRHANREIVFRVLLVGKDLAAVRCGFNWLATVLRGGDVCAKTDKVRHTYADFMPYTKNWWQSYKRDQVDVIPDNMYQANEYVGIASGPTAANGNTYANLLKNGPAGTTKDALDILIPLTKNVTVDRTCEGNSLAFFMDCPDEDTADDLYRFISNANLTSGPVILGEHVLSGPDPDCQAGAWQEVEFTLTAVNPKVWWLPKTLSAQDNRFDYDDYLAEWAIYRDTDLTTDLDVRQATLYAGVADTYSALTALLFDRSSTTLMPDGQIAVRGASRSFLTSAPSWGDKPDTRASLILDPDCPQPPKFPTVATEEYFCHQIPAGDWVSLTYFVGTFFLPKFSPAAISIYLEAEEELKDVIVKIFPSNRGVDSDQDAVMFYITYIPAGGALLVDGVAKRIDMRITDPSDSSVRLWTSAEHMVYSDPLGSGYRYPEITCGRDFTVVVEHLDIYDSDSINVDVSYTPRDG